MCCTRVHSTDTWTCPLISASPLSPSLTDDIPQEPLYETEIIDLCSTSSDEEAAITFSPVKSQLAPIDIVKDMIPSVKDDDYHNPETKRLSQTANGLGITQLFTLTIAPQ